MKHKAPQSWIALASILFIPFISFSQSETTITLTVDTEKITKDNIKQPGILTLKDNRSQDTATGEKIKGFKSDINRSQDVTVVGEPVNTSIGHSVLIDKIVRKRRLGTRRMLEKDDYDGVAGQIEAKARSKKGIGMKHRYVIYFTVRTPEGDRKFNSDPKLKMRIKI